jgi:ribosome-binding protein aMBF1 (putative translation factor)
MYIMQSFTLLSITVWPAGSREERFLADVMVRFGQRLRTVRQQKGISQEKLADFAGLHRTYVSSVERGERNISLLNIEKLASALGVPMAQLMPDE